MDRARTVRLLALAALAALVWLAFERVLGTGFLCTDDDDYVTQNAMVRAGLTAEGWTWAWTTFRGAHWHPLTWLSLMLDVELFGAGPEGFHRTNLLLHAAVAVLLAVTLHGWTGSWARSWLAAALFAVHPMRLESVAWITERKDVLSGLLFVLALLAYGRHARAPHWTRLAPVVVLHALGLLAKPMAVTLPALLLLLDVWPFRRWDAAAPRGRLLLVAEKLPLLAVSLASSVVTLHAQQSLGAVAALDAQPLGGRIAGAFAAYGGYLFRTVWPERLSVCYPLADPPAAEWIASAVVVAGVSVWAVAGRRGRPWAFTGWAWFLGMLVPVIGLVQVGSVAEADRFTYLPSVGLAVAVAWLLPPRAERDGRPVAPSAAALAVCGAAIAALFASTRRQSDHWQSSLALYGRALEVTHDNVFAELQVATLLLEAGDVPGAQRHAVRALELSPQNARVLLAAGMVEAAAGRLDEALAHLTAAADGLPGDAAPHIGLAQVHQAAGRPGDAERELRAALELRPDLAVVRTRLGVLAAGAGRLDEAEEHFLAAARLEPADPDVHTNLGNVAALRRRWPEAVLHHGRAWELRPGDPRIAANLAASLLDGGRAGEAVEFLAGVLPAHPGDARLRDLFERARRGR